MINSTHAIFTKQVSAVLVLAAVLGLSACNKAEENKAPEPTPTETTATAPGEEATPEAAVPEPIESETPAEATQAPAAATASTETDATAAPELAADAGKALYEKQCQVCHAQGLLEAPKFADKAAWAARIAKGKDTLYEHSVKGFNKMPPQANGDVTEAQVHAAVDYMVAAAS